MQQPNNLISDGIYEIDHTRLDNTGEGEIPVGQFKVLFGELMWSTGGIPENYTLHEILRVYGGNPYYSIASVAH